MDYTNQNTTEQEGFTATMPPPPPASMEDLAPRRTIWHRLLTALSSIPAYVDRYIHRFQCPYCFAFVHRGMKHHYGHSGRPGATVYQCASCQTELPSDFFASRSTSIAVVGGTDAGKSSFITLFCELLLYRKSLLGELGIYGSIINENGREQFKSNRMVLIRQELALQGTTKEQPPIVVRLHSKHHKKVTYITLMDSPGEDFRHINVLVNKHPNLQYARGIVFLMNPLDIAELLDLVRKEKPGTVLPGKETNNRNFEIIETLYQLYLRTGRVRPNRKIKAATAFCLSRADLLEDIANLYLPPDFEPEMEDAREILGEAELVTADLRELLEETDKNLLNIMTKQFRNYSIFPVSPLGKTPVPDATGDRVQGGVEPKGVLQPIIWILHQTKFIKQS